MKRDRDDKSLALIPKSSAGLTDAGQLTTTRNAAMPKRTSSLPEAYLERPSRHTSDALSIRFSPTGRFVATTGMDKIVKVSTGCGYEITSNLLGHRHPVLDLDWCSDEWLFTSASDGYVTVWDVERAQPLRSVKAHPSGCVINSIATLPKSTLLLTAGDDATVRCTDVRVKQTDMKVLEGLYPCTCLASSHDGNTIFVGDITGRISVYDFREGDLMNMLGGHTDVVSCLRAHPDGTTQALLSSAMDGTVRVWDVKPFVPEGKEQLFVGTGHSHTLSHVQVLPRCAWSRDHKIAIGSGVGPYSVLLWDDVSRACRPLPAGHKAVVSAVDLHPYEPIVASCACDGSLTIQEF